eukprot:TRINITY_DN2614_c0_g1_i2.p1 TRINITY_DN2614_c0_g1~~TRINITY_DN2614_c0_g1_i2.p1  ORF type:complete len:617 (-),score=159.94 TRINITY_DN2614_c0_g1_i2:10-1860(-)
MKPSQTGVRFMSTTIASFCQPQSAHRIASGLQAIRQWYSADLKPAVQARFSTSTGLSKQANVIPDQSSDHAIKHTLENFTTESAEAHLFHDRAIKHTLAHFANQNQPQPPATTAEPQPASTVDETLQQFTRDALQQPADGSCESEQAWLPPKSLALMKQMRLLLEMDRGAQAYALFCRHKETASISAWNMALGVLSRSGDYGRMDRMWAEMKQSTGPGRPNAHSYTLVLAALARRHGGLGMMQAEFDHLVHHSGIQPNVIHFTAIISAHASARDVAGARRYLTDMARRSIVPTPVMVLALVEAFAHAGSEPEMLAVFDAFRRRGQHDTMARKIYNTVLHFYGKRGRLEEMEVLFGEMQQQGDGQLLSQPRPFVIAIDALLAAGRTDPVGPLLRLMRVKGIQPTYEIYHALLKHAARLGLNWQIENNLSCMHRDGVRLDSALLLLVLQCYATAGDTAGMARHLWQALPTLRSEATCRFCLEACEKAGDRHGANSIRRYMAKRGMNLSPSPADAGAETRAENATARPADAARATSETAAAAEAVASLGTDRNASTADRAFQTSTAAETDAASAADAWLPASVMDDDALAEQLGGNDGPPAGVEAAAAVFFEQRVQRLT